MMPQYTEKTHYSKTQPIITVVPQNEQWKMVLIYSNETAFADYRSSRGSADKTAKVWAEKNNVSYVPTNGTFISIFDLKKTLNCRVSTYVACEVPIDGMTKGKSTIFADFQHAKAEAEVIAKKENKPFVPHFFVESKTTTYTYTQILPN